MKDSLRHQARLLEENAALQAKLEALEEELRQARSMVERCIPDPAEDLIKANRALQESEARLRLAQISSGAGVWDWDIPDSKLKWSKELYQLFGLDPEKNEASFDSWTSALYPADKEAAEERIQSAIRNHAPLDSEYRILRPSGEVRWIHALGSTAYGDDGRPERMLGICLDVTNSKRADEALYANRQLLETVVNNMPAAVCVIRGSDLTIALVNPGYQAIAPAIDMVGKTLDELWPETGQDFAELCRRVLISGEPYQVKNELNMIRRRPAGPLEAAYFTWSLHRVKLPGDEGWGILNMALETTEYHRAEEALRQSEAHFRVLTETLPQIVWSADTDGNVKYFNQRWFEYIGEPHGFGDVSRWDKVIHPDDLARAQQSWQEARKAESSFQNEIRLRRHDGLYRWFLASGLPLRDAGGKVVSWFGSNTDIHDMKEAEEELRLLNESLEKRVAERTKEIRRQAEQLRALATQLTLAEQKERKRLAQVLHDHIQQLIVAARMQFEYISHVNQPTLMHEALQLGTSILDEALNASRSLAIDLSPPVLHEVGLIAALKWLADRMKEQHHFTVNLHADAGTDPTPEELRFLLFDCARELLLNAIKHSGAKGADVGIERTKHDCIILQVSDTGKGFDAAYLAENPPKTTLGLFNIQQRISQISGHMEVETSPDKGTRITLTVPVVAAASSAPRAG
jgi:PAS domain S-box-containing protein